MKATTTYRRQKAIDDLLRLMGCTDAKRSNCEHVAAVSELADACYLTLFEELDRVTGGALSLFNLKPKTETWINPDAAGRREGKLR